MFDLRNKKALITGAGSGIGKAIAQTLASAGARIWILERQEEGARATADAIKAVGGKAEFAIVDVSDAGEVSRLSPLLPAFDIVVNNAGIGHVGDLNSTSSEDLDRLFAVNVRGAFNICKAFVPALLDNKRGSVINIASVGGIVAVRERLAYTTTKFAVVGLTKALALDHSHTGVRFNCICPGRVLTPFVEARLAEYPDPKAAYQEMAATQLNGRMARPEEIAAAALYLASDESAMVTGSSLMVDGGWTAGK